MPEGETPDANEPPIRPGLCSVTLRPLAPEAVVRVAADAGLAGIEWGGDIHVPPGDAATARRAARLTADAGLIVSSYGSYYRVGGDKPGELQPILDTAADLGAPVVRVWAGPANLEKRAGRGCGVSAPPPDEFADLWRETADDLNRAASLAQAAGVTLALEHHPGTFTADAGGALELLSRLDKSSRGRVGCYWQPNQHFADDAARTRDLPPVLPHLLHLHVFQWQRNDGQTVRFPLADGEATWRQWLELAATAPPMPGGRFALLEFVKGDDPAQVAADAATLKRLLASLA